MSPFRRESLGNFLKFLRVRRFRFSSLWLPLLFIPGFYLAGFVQSPQSSSISLLTDSRLRSNTWWPTSGAPSRAEYAGSDACIDCHELKAESQEQTPMFHAAVRPPQSKGLREHRDLAFHLGPYSYRLTTADAESVLTVGDGSASLSADLLWSFGSGHMGQTFLYQKGGRFYESHVSYFSALQALDITPGQKHTVPANLDEALGRALPLDEARRCFACHTTASSRKDAFDPHDPFPGVTCEACHGPAAKHVAAARAKTEKRGSGLIFNPGKLERVDSVDFCGACHRTWQDVVGQPPVARTFNVRFAPYRLENSRCWEKGDARLTCMACHDPHKPLVREAGAYDANCLACHAATAAEKRTSNHPGPACPVATKDCVTCHMPKVEPPGLHSAFTDHWIRVVRPNASYPE